MTEIVTIENVSEVPQHVYWKGTKHSIGPHSFMDVQKHIANTFLTERGKYVRWYQEDNEIYTKPGFDTVWLANMTGNPFGPQTYTKYVVEKGVEKEIELVHPAKDVRPIAWDIPIGQIERDIMNPMGDVEKVMINRPPMRCKLGRFQRKPFAEDIADRVLGMCSWGEAAQSRPLTNWEPNETWGLDELRLYAVMIDEDTFDLRNIPGEKEFEKKTKEVRELREKAEKDKKPTLEFEAEEAQIEVDARKLKDDLFVKIFFRIVDERYALPTQDIFKMEAKKLGVKTST